MNQYIPSSNDEQMEMLKSVNAKSIEDLFVDIPESIRLKKKSKLKRSFIRTRTVKSHE